jgi:ComF family protein
MAFLRRIIDFLLPTRCAHCRSPLGEPAAPFFCSSCWADFSTLQGRLCPRCGRPFASPEALAHSPEHECGACRRSPPRYDQALAVGQFEGALREAIHQYKYRPCRSLAAPLARWMLDHLRVLTTIDVIMPVPLHRSRLRERGFNQALLLASTVSKAHGIPLSYDNLTRFRSTRPQVELSGEERVLNVRGAFRLAKPEDVEGKRILLVDDVFTTGATMNECAAVLKSAGALSVVALTLARTAEA